MDAVAPCTRLHQTSSCCGATSETGSNLLNTSFGHRSAEAGPSIARRFQRTTNAEKTHFISTEGDGDIRRGHTFAAVEAMGGALPDVEVTTAWASPL